jgi:hypothetical protein
MKVIGIGGAGGKIAAKMDSDNAILVNVSQTELDKVIGGGERIVAPIQSIQGQFKGSRKEPQIGLEAYRTIRRRLLENIRGSIVFSSTGGGTGNGITKGIMEDIVELDENAEGGHGLPIQDKTVFCLLLPDDSETKEYVENSISFLSESVANVIDKGCTGNIMLFSNKRKFAEKIGEDAYNQMIVDSLNVFMAIPQKNENLKLLELHIDQEDFSSYIAKPYFNHFCYFDYDRTKDLGLQIKANSNSLLLPPEEAIEVMFLLEVPSGQDHTMFYDILQYYNKLKSPPVYSVVENPSLQRPFLTLSMLYSRKPIEVVEEFNQKNVDNMEMIIQRSLKQHVVLQKVAVDMNSEAKRAGEEIGINAEILSNLKRIGKIK